MDDLDQVQNDLEALFARRRQQRELEGTLQPTTGTAGGVVRQQEPKFATGRRFYLPPAVMVNIFCYLTVSDFGRGVPRVGPLWARAFHDPAVWASLCKIYHLPPPAKEHLLVSSLPGTSEGQQSTTRYRPTTSKSFSSRVSGAKPRPADAPPNTALEHFRQQMTKQRELRKEAEEFQQAGGKDYGPRPHGTFSNRVTAEQQQRQQIEEKQAAGNTPRPNTTPKTWMEPRLTVGEEVALVTAPGATHVTGMRDVPQVTTMAQEVFHTPTASVSHLPEVGPAENAAAKVQRMENKLQVFRGRLDRLSEGSAALDAPIRNMALVDEALLAESERHGAAAKQMLAASIFIRRYLSQVEVQKNRRNLVAQFERLIIVAVTTPQDGGGGGPLLLGTFAQLEMHALSSHVFGTTLSLRWNIAKRTLPCDDLYFDVRDALVRYGESALCDEEEDETMEEVAAEDAASAEQRLRRSIKSEAVLKEANKKRAKSSDTDLDPRKERSRRLASIVNVVSRFGSQDASVNFEKVIAVLQNSASSANATAKPFTGMSTAQAAPASPPRPVTQELGSYDNTSEVL